MAGPSDAWLLALLEQRGYITALKGLREDLARAVAAEVAGEEEVEEELGAAEAFPIRAEQSGEREVDPNCESRQPERSKADASETVERPAGTRLRGKLIEVGGGFMCAAEDADPRTLRMSSSRRPKARVSLVPRRSSCRRGRWRRRGWPKRRERQRRIERSSPNAETDKKGAEMRSKLCCSFPPLVFTLYARGAAPTAAVHSARIYRYLHALTQPVCFVRPRKNA